MNAHRPMHPRWLTVRQHSRQSDLFYLYYKVFYAENVIGFMSSFAGMPRMFHCIPMRASLLPTSVLLRISVIRVLPPRVLCCKIRVGNGRRQSSWQRVTNTASQHPIRGGYFSKIFRTSMPLVGHESWSATPLPDEVKGCNTVVKPHNLEGKPQQRQVNSLFCCSPFGASRSYGYVCY